MLRLIFLLTYSFLLGTAATASPFGQQTTAQPATTTSTGFGGFGGFNTAAKPNTSLFGTTNTQSP
jgi:hypothetical protein